MVELRRATLGVGQQNCLAVVVEVGDMADLEEGHRTGVVGIGLGVVLLLHKVAVGKEDSPAVVDLSYEEEDHMAAVGVEGIPVAGGMDCVKELRMVVVGMVGSPGYTGPAVHILLAAAEVTEAADLVRSLHLADTLRVAPRSGLPARILEGVRQAHHSPAGVGSLVVGILDEGIDSVKAAGTPLSKSE